MHEIRYALGPRWESWHPPWRWPWQRQPHAATLERLAQIVERDEEPLLTHWV